VNKDFDYSVWAYTFWPPCIIVAASVDIAAACTSTHTFRIRFSNSRWITNGSEPKRDRLAHL